MKSVCHFLGTLLLWSSPMQAADWPQWMGPDRAGIWDEPAVAERVDPDKAVMVWSFPSGGGYAGPAVAGGKVFHMAFHADREQAGSGQGPAGRESLTCLDAGTGAVLWRQDWKAAYQIDYPSGPRATPTVQGNRVYALGAEGRLLCADTGDGKIIWQHDLPADLPCKPPTWGFAGHPVVYGDLLICLAAGEGSTCVTFDRHSGEEKWRALGSRHAGYCPPVIIHPPGGVQVVLWHGEAVNGLDPATGKVLWTLPQVSRNGVSMASPILQGDRLLVSSYWWGSWMLRFSSGQAEPQTVWRTGRESDTRTEHLNALMCTPMLADGYLYGICSQGQLRCLDWETGARRWETLAATGGKAQPWGTAFLTRLGPTGNDWLLFNEQGELIKARLTPAGYDEQARRSLISPDSAESRGRSVVWSHPAYSGGHVFVRNNRELRCWRLIPEPSSR